MESEIDFIKIKIEKMKDRYKSLHDSFNSLATELKTIDVAGNFSILVKTVESADTKLLKINELF